VIADDLVEIFEPVLTPDLETYLRAVALMFDEVEMYSTDDGDFEGWTILFDPDRAPVGALPYLAQFVGEKLPVGLGEAESREWIKDRPNATRGTAMSMVLAAQRNLTGQRTVSWRERWDGSVVDVDYAQLRTFTHETPDPAATERDVLSTTPADVILVYSAISGQSWADVIADHTDWDDVEGDYATWAEAVTDLPGSFLFTRPGP
jgi:hypothetical protein